MQPVISLNDLLINVSKSECILLGVCLCGMYEIIIYIIYKIFYIFGGKNDR